MFMLGNSRYARSHHTVCSGTSAKQEPSPQQLPWYVACDIMWYEPLLASHYNDVIMITMASQITSLTIVYSTVYSRRRSKKASKLRVTGLCAGNSPETGEFPAPMASNAENVSIWWRHNVHLQSFEDALANKKGTDGSPQWENYNHDQPPYRRLQDDVTYIVLFHCATFWG